MSVSRHILKSLVSRRSIHLSSRLNIDPKTAEEIKIPVPWGHIAGKRWGDQVGQPIIALHGLLDNSSSFDKLLPLLDAPSVLCLDLHGHGQSSHLPKGISIYYGDYIFQLRYLLKHLYKWDKNLVFMGHSFGSIILFNYAAIYPDEVSKMINIECARFRNAIKTEKFIKETRKSADSFLNAEKETDISGYNFVDCVNHMMKVRDSIHLPLSKEYCTVLAKRGTNNLGNGKHYFSHDKRLKIYSFGRNTNLYNLALASRIKCNVMNIHAIGGINTEEYGLEEDKHIKVMGENCNSCLNLVLEGGHHLHLETPEVVAPHINKFLSS